MSSSAMAGLYRIAESARGTTPATPVWTPIRKTSFSVGLEKETFASKELRVDGARSATRHGAKKVSVSVEGELSYGSWDTMLAGVLCGDWTTDVLVPSSPRLRTFDSIEAHYADQVTGDNPYHRFLGCEWNEFTMKAGKGGTIVDLSFAGISMTASAPAAAIISGATYSATATTVPFAGFDATLIEEGGADASAIVSDFELKVTNNMDRDYVLNSADTLEPTIGVREISGSLTVRFIDDVQLLKFMTETHSSAQITFTDAAGNTLDFLLPKICYTSGGIIQASGNNPLSLTMAFNAEYDSVTSADIVITRNPV